jgi:hypothetical protein
MNIKYHYIVMSQKDILLDQVLEEILREKTSYYLAQNKIPDFWILVSPNFIEEQKLSAKIRTTKFFQDQKDKILVEWPTGGSREFYVALISSDEDYMSWIKLRLGYFEEIETLRENLVPPSYVSDGVCGILSVDENEDHNLSVLGSNYSHLHPDIIDSGLCNKIESFYTLLT